MTAPDVNADVRAKFEAWLAREMNDAEPMKKRNGDYMDPETRNLWLAWQARGADLAGEVRELVEVVRELADDLREWGATDFQLAMRAALLEAALAKFHPTHQEKP